MTTHLKRHSLVLIRVENLKWYGPRITFCIIVYYIVIVMHWWFWKNIFDHFLQCVVLKMWFQMLWKILESPIQRRRSQCREEMRRWGIGACLAQLPDIRMIVILVTCCRIWWWLWSWWRRPGSPSLWGSGRCRFWRSRDIWGDRTRPEGSRCLIWRYCDHDDSDDGKEHILTEHETANIPHVADDGLGLDQLLDDRSDDDQQVVRADHHIPDDKNIMEFYDWFIDMITLMSLIMIR